jgi:hypothetical protein
MSDSHHRNRATSSSGGGVPPNATIYPRFMKGSFGSQRKHLTQSGPGPRRYTNRSIRRSIINHLKELDGKMDVSNQPNSLVRRRTSADQINVGMRGRSNPLASD